MKKLEKHKIVVEIVCSIGNLLLEILKLWIIF